MHKKKARKEMRKAMVDASYQEMKERKEKEQRATSTGKTSPPTSWRKPPEVEFEPEELEAHDTDKK